MRKGVFLTRLADICGLIAAGQNGVYVICTSKHQNAATWVTVDVVRQEGVLDRVLWVDLFRNVTRDHCLTRQ